MGLDAQEVVNRAAIQLYDPGHVNWSESELLGSLREGLGALATLRPDLFTQTKTVPLAAGAQQAPPTGATRVTRVIGTRETETGPVRGVTWTDVRSMNTVQPGWQGVSGRPRQYGTSPDQEVYWLYPAPPDANHYADVEAVFVPEIPDVADWGTDPTAIDLDARFERALLDFMLYRAYSKDSDVGANPNRAAQHYQAFNEGALDTFYSPEMVSQAQNQQTADARNRRR